MSVKISVTTKLIKLFILQKLYIGPVMVSGHFTDLPPQMAMETAANIFLKVIFSPDFFYSNFFNKEFLIAK